MALVGLDQRARTDKMSNAPAKTTDDYIADGHTPMMAQYMAVKAQHADCLVFYRMGDFYELFFSDAETAARVLDITLTKRGRSQGDDIPMCGVPWHSHEAYLSRLIKNGYKVAICEQLETPEQAKKRGGAKAMIRRDVVRVITPGTITEDTLLPASQHNYLAAMAQAGGESAVAWADISTGQWWVETLPAGSLTSQIAKIMPSELLLRASIKNPQTHIPDGVTCSLLPEAAFDSLQARQILTQHYPNHNWNGFSAAEISALGVIWHYLTQTQKGNAPLLLPPQRVITGQTLEIDPATRRNLEISQTLQGQRAGSLLWAIDKTLTPAGARLLSARIAAPLASADAINQRLSQVEIFIRARAACPRILTLLRGVPDSERAISRLTANRGLPRDLAGLRDTLRVAKEIQAHLASMSEVATVWPDILHQLTQTEPLQALQQRLQSALRDSLPALFRDGGVIAHGYDDTLDTLRSLRDDSHHLILALEKKYTALTEIESLKIVHNNILGFYIEVPAKRADKLLTTNGGDPALTSLFIHRQTMASAVRFTTLDLTQLERDLNGAADKALAHEQQLINRLIADSITCAPDFLRIASALATLDVTLALAELAATHNYARPVVDTSDTFTITQGRHPVVEAALHATGGQAFIPNDCNLSAGQRLWLLTGPNMAGKSTFLRQNALITLMAQIGSFVPAAAAHIGVVDKLFSRVGAADDLARGQSTFMVEMTETATILNRATPRSLVILDEIGRGTATYDGMAIAWACVEYLHNAVQCRGLFATHYHELTDLADQLDDLTCHTLDVKEWKGDIVFLHTVKPGTADGSYGLHVAKLAGLPTAVLARAKTVLAGLERAHHLSPASLPLFDLAASAPSNDMPAYLTTVLDTLTQLQPDSLSPREALDTLYALTTLCKDNT